MPKPVLVIIVPCYNEEEVLPVTVHCLNEKLAQLVFKEIIKKDSALLFVDDGSKDNTWNLIEEYNKQNPKVFYGIKLTKNYGHQNALLCGLLAVKDFADVTITIDADYTHYLLEKNLDFSPASLKQTCRNPAAE